MKKIFIFFLTALVFTGCTQNNPQKSPVPQIPEAKAVAAADEYSDGKAYGWGFKKIENSAPEVPNYIIELISKYNCYYIGDNQKKELFLTFDEGYENGYTSVILDVLKEQNVPAAFFITGPYLKREQALVKRMVEEGHIVGNHTVNHYSMPKISNEKIEDELNCLNKDFECLTGQKMKYLRPPKGEYSERTLQVANQLGYKTIFWSSAYADWDLNKQNGKENAIKKITSQFHNGNIILMHAVSKDNTEALEDIINIARQQGYEFKSLDNL